MSEAPRKVGYRKGQKLMQITVFSKPDCVQCTATYSSLDAQGLDYEIVDLTADDAALERRIHAGPRRDHR